jgi:site-specific DNA-methyltransferase (adenine-specific)
MSKQKSQARLNPNRLQWSLKTIKIDEIKEYESNPRILTKHDHKQLRQSIDKFGLIDKPVVNPDMTLIGGHQRVRILKEDCIEEVECWIPNRELTQDEFRELNIRLNKNHGDFDFEILANEYDSQFLLASGFEEKELLDGFDIPKFDETDGGDQPDLTETKKKVCPSCGHEF